MIVYKKALSAWAAMLGMALAVSGHAAITVNVNSAAGAVGGNVVVTHDYAALDADNVGGYQFDILYNPSDLTTVDVTTCANNAPATHAGSFCAEPGGAGNGTVRSVIADLNPPTDEIMPTNIAPIGQWTFSCLQPGVHTLTFNNPAAGDVTGANVPISGNNATITCAIVGNPGYDSVPTSGTALNLGSAVVGTTTASQNVTVSEIGDQQLDVNGSVGGTNPGDFSAAPLVFSIADGGAPVDVVVDCTPSARGNLSATLNLSNNSINTPNATHDLNCIGLSPNVGVAPLTINLNGVITGPAPSGSFDVTNTQDGFASDAGNASLTEGTLGGTITITDGLTDATISVNETDGVTVSCSTAAAGMFSDTVTVQWNDPLAPGGVNSAVVTVNCDISNAVPSFTSTPAAPGPLAFGNVTNGTTSAPIGINVGNDGIGPSPQSDLDISGVVSSNPAVFAATLVNAGPFPIGAPSGGDDITVTCSPPPGSVAQIAGTLTVNHDGDDNPTVFNLTCDPVSDAQFGSTPPAGNVAIGTVFPGNTGTTTIILENNGATDDLSNVDCAITAGDPEIAIDSPTFPVGTLPAGGTINMVVSCTVQTPGLFSADIACSAQDPAGAPQTLNFTVTCTGQPLVVPTLSYWGLIALALLLVFGGLAAYRFRATA